MFGRRSKNDRAIEKQAFAAAQDRPSPPRETAAPYPPGQPSREKPPLRVAIIAGGAKEKYFLHAHYDYSWEIWGLNAIRPDNRPQNRWAPVRWARMFNLHRFAHLNRDCYEYIIWDADWSKNNPTVPFYVIDTWNGLLANEHLFPRHQLHTVLGPRGGIYHAGSIDMMVAYAIALGAVEIGLHGVGLALDTPRGEPISARACLEYWCGFAEGRGVKVKAMPDCDILRQYHLVVSDTTYGYDDVKLVVEARDLNKDAATYGPLPRDDGMQFRNHRWQDGKLVVEPLDFKPPEAK